MDKRKDLGGGYYAEFNGNEVMFGTEAVPDIELILNLRQFRTLCDWVRQQTHERGEE